MSQQHTDESHLWESLIACLGDDECDGISMDDSRNREDMVNGVHQNHTAPLLIDRHQPASAGFIPRNEPDFINTGRKFQQVEVNKELVNEAHVQAPSRPVHLSLREWIRHAVRVTGNNKSSSYLEAAITIALSLAEQIEKAEKLDDQYGITKKLDSMPLSSASNWAKCVTVRVKEHDEDWGGTQKLQVSSAETKHNDDVWEPLPLLKSNVNDCAEDEEQLCSFLRDSLGDKDEIEASAENDCFASTTSTSHADENSGDSQVVYGGVGTFSCQGKTDTILDSSTASSIRNFGPCYMDIESAEIKCPEGDCGSCFDRKIQKVKRMYFLSLLFYELFTGGEKPPHNLQILASTKDAFVSLSTLTLVKIDDQEYNAKRRQCPTGSRQEIGLCQLSYQYLLFMGIPGPLCTLVFNMMDCVHGDLRSSESYTAISHVTFDLRLMLDQPSIYLKDLDVEALSSTGLGLDGLVISREDEFRAIRDCYRRSVSNSCEFVVITGSSGSGKSWLCDLAEKAITSEGGLFLRCKFDMMKQAKPFAELALVLEQCCNMLIRDINSPWAKVAIANLQTVLSDNSSILLKMVPTLNNLLPGVVSRESTCALPGSEQNCKNAVQRLHYLICKFVEIISASSDVSVTVAWDDAQWADVASLSVMHRLMKQKHKKLFFLACCRDDEMTTEHTLFKLANATIRLRSMQEDELDKKIAELLRLPPRIVRPLSKIVYSKTAGNVQFVHQLLIALHEDGLLKLDFEQKRWVWNIESICATKLPDNVALCFVNGMKKLSPEVQTALHTLSLFGASVKPEHIMILESQLNLKLIEPLDEAVQRGLVNSLNGMYHFSHDRIQEASYRLIDERFRVANHLTYGQCLVKCALENEDDDLFFIAVNHINLGSSAVTNGNALHAFVSYNLSAGKKSMAVANISAANAFFCSGISFLPDNHWRDTQYYHLSLEIFELAAKTSLAMGDVQRFHVFSNQVTSNARCFEDKLNVFYIVLLSLIFASKISDAIEQGVDIVRRLGEEIPHNLSKEVLDQQMRDTQALLRGLSKDDILNYPLMQDTKKIMAMKFIGRLQYVAFFAKPALHQYFVLKIVQLTLTHGLASMSPIGIVTFGSMLAKIGDIQTGRAFTLLGESLLEKLAESETSAAVIATVCDVQCFVQPVQAAMELHKQGESTSIANGDSHWICMHRLLYCQKLFWIGTNLSSTLETLEKAVLLMKEHEHQVTLFFVASIQRLVSKLMGQDKTTVSLCANSPLQVKTLCFQDMYLSFFMLSNKDLKERATEYFEVESKTRSNLLMFTGSAQAFVGGLAAYKICRTAVDPSWKTIGDMCKNEMKHWAEEGNSQNFKHKLLLLLAEESYCKGEFESARGFYAQAIEAAKVHRFVNDLAISYECAARFYLETGDLRTSFEQFRFAHEAYTKWGAVGKATQVFTLITEQFSDCLR